MAKATASYEKSRPRTARQTTTMTEAAQAAAAHDKYITSLSTLSSSISILKTGYAEMAAERREKAVKEAARVLCSLAETAWKNRVEGTKKGGEKAGEVVARGVWCEVAMPDMSLLGEEEQSEEPSVARAVEASVEDQPQTSPQTISGLRGPRALPGTVYAAEQHQQQQSDFPTSSVPPLDPSLFAPSTDHPDSNTYEVQGVNALQPPNASTMPQASFPNASPISTRSLEFPPEPQPLPASPPIRPTPSCQPSFPHPVRQASPISFTHNSAPLPPLNQSQAEPEPASRPPFEHQVESSTSATDDILEIYNTPPVSSAPATSQSLPAPVAVTASELRRPTPRHGAAPDLTPTHPSTLERNDTTTSERNFVARMREKYAEEKELKREAEERERERSRAAGQTVSSTPRIKPQTPLLMLAHTYSPSPPTSLDPPLASPISQSVTVHHPPPQHLSTRATLLHHLTELSQLNDPSLSKLIVIPTLCNLPRTPTLAEPIPHVVRSRTSVDQQSLVSGLQTPLPVPLQQKTTFPIASALHPPTALLHSPSNLSHRRAEEEEQDHLDPTHVNLFHLLLILQSALVRSVLRKSMVRLVPQRLKGLWEGRRG